MEPHILVHEGFLKKSPPLAKMHQKWHRRYFRLYSDKKLEYFKRKGDTKPLREPIDLSECIGVHSTEQQFLRKYKKSDYKHVFYLSTATRNYHLVADTEGEMLLWQEKLGQILGFHGSRDIEEVAHIIGERERLPIGGRSLNSSPHRLRTHSATRLHAVVNAGQRALSISLPSINVGALVNSDKSVTISPGHSRSDSIPPDGSESSLSSASHDTSDLESGSPSRELSILLTGLQNPIQYDKLLAEDAAAAYDSENVLPAADPVEPPSGNLKGRMQTVSPVIFEYGKDEFDEQVYLEPPRYPVKSVAGKVMKQTRTLPAPAQKPVSSPQMDASQQSDVTYVDMNTATNTSSPQVKHQVICQGQGLPPSSIATVGSNVTVIIGTSSTGHMSNADTAGYEVMQPAPLLMKKPPADIAMPKVTPRLETGCPTVTGTPRRSTGARVPLKHFDITMDMPGCSPHMIAPNPGAEGIGGTADSAQLRQAISHPKPSGRSMSPEVAVMKDPAPIADVHHSASARIGDSLSPPPEPSRDSKPKPKVDRNLKPKLENGLMKNKTFSYSAQDRKRFYENETVNASLVELSQSMDERMLHSSAGVRLHTVPVPGPKPSLIADSSMAPRSGSPYSVPKPPSQQRMAEPVGLGSSLSFRQDLPDDGYKELTVDLGAFPGLRSRPELGSPNYDYPCEYQAPVVATDYGKRDFYSNVPAPVSTLEYDAPAYVERSTLSSTAFQPPRNTSNIRKNYVEVDVEKSAALRNLRDA